MISSNAFKPVVVIPSLVDLKGVALGPDVVIFFGQETKDLDSNSRRLPVTLLESKTEPGRSRRVFRLEFGEVGMQLSPRRAGFALKREGVEDRGKSADDSFP